MTASKKIADYPEMYSLAQLVEHQSRDPKVPGSIPGGSVNFSLAVIS